MHVQVSSLAREAQGLSHTTPRMPRINTTINTDFISQKRYNITLSIPISLYLHPSAPQLALTLELQSALTYQGFQWRRLGPETPAVKEVPLSQLSRGRVTREIPCYGTGRDPTEEHPVIHRFSQCRDMSCLP
jgi:hypothetical protein